MKKYVKSVLLKIFWSISKSMRIHSINRMLVELNYFNLINNKRYNDKKNLINYGFKVYFTDEDE